MRFKLQLEVNKNVFGNRLPINYQYEQSAVIYRILARADKDYATWLHENGYRMENGKTFKFFSYSRFMIEKYKVLREKGQLQILSDTIEWQISFLPEKSTQRFIQGLFMNQVFEVGDRRSKVQFIVRNVEVMPSPDFTEEMTFRTLSPMCLKLIDESGKVQYLSPTAKETLFILFNGLKDRYVSYYGNLPDFFMRECRLQVLDKPKSVLVKMKADTKEQTFVRGFMCTFRVYAPVALMKLMYEAGAGCLCAQGFGCLSVE